jgi:predicted signal transduction protein with EAL and GGDEF domain
VARIGGDEFALIIERCQQREAAEQFARRLIDELSAPVMLDNYPVVVSVSIGAALYPEASDNAEGLLKRAVLAMRQAKLERGSSLQLYSEETKLESLQRLSLEADLRKALRRNEFELHYQPRVDLISGETLGMESLIRWRHPTRGWVSPQEFIPVAEESGLIIPIGYWTIKQACDDMNAFTKAGYGHLEVAVNLSFKQLQDSLFVETATRIIEQSGVDASQLEFELTETAIMSNFQQTYDGMMALAKLGITFSLDDFGTGFSSFAHIQKLPISALKIDRSFIRRVIENNDDAVIVRAIINLAHSLRLRVIGEGVETLEQVQFLWQHCCDQVQGYYFSPAIPAADFCRLVDQRVTVTA